MAKNQLIYYIEMRSLGRGFRVFDSSERQLFEVESPKVFDAGLLLKDTYGKTVAEVKDKSGWFGFQFDVYRKSTRVAIVERDGFSFRRSFVVHEKRRRSSAVQIKDAALCCGGIAFELRRRGRRIATLMEHADGICLPATFALIVQEQEDAITLLCASIVVCRAVDQQRKSTAAASAAI